MCGIVAYSGKSLCDIHKLKLLMMFNLSRGKDSSGFYARDNINDITKQDIELGTLDSSLLPKDNIIPCNLFLGHARAATSGTKTILDAQPIFLNEPAFELDLVGVHNGTLTNHRLMLEHLKKESSNNFLDLNHRSDTHIFYNFLFTLGYKEALQRFDGAGTFIWTYSNNNILYVYRHDEQRPLFLGKTEEGIYFSSIEASLKSIGCTDIAECLTGIIFQFADGELVGEEADIDRSPFQFPKMQAISQKALPESSQTYQETQKTPSLGKLVKSSILYRIATNNHTFFNYQENDARQYMANVSGDTVEDVYLCLTRNRYYHMVSFKTNIHFMEQEISEMRYINLCKSLSKNARIKTTYESNKPTTISRKNHFDISKENNNINNNENNNNSEIIFESGENVFLNIKGILVPAIIKNRSNNLKYTAYIETDSDQQNSSIYCRIPEDVILAKDEAKWVKEADTNYNPIDDCISEIKEDLEILIQNKDVQVYETAGMILDTISQLEIAIFNASLNT
jgi:hypothetical protein